MTDLAGIELLGPELAHRGFMAAIAGGLLALLSAVEAQKSGKVWRIQEIPDRLPNFKVPPPDKPASDRSRLPGCRSPPAYSARQYEDFVVSQLVPDSLARPVLPRAGGFSKEMKNGTEMLPRQCSPCRMAWTR